MSANSQQASTDRLPGNATKTTPDRLLNSAWFPRGVPIAPDGTLQIALPPPSNGHSLADNNNIKDAVTNKSHEILGGIILGSGHRHLAQSLNPVEPLDFNGRAANPKSSKYVGVTYRPNRAKFQARIYKGNKEFNLGLFDLSADAALAYDVTHRLLAEVEKITRKEFAGKKKQEDLSAKMGKGLPVSLSTVIESTEASRNTRIRMELSKLNELEKNPSLTSLALNWLEGGSFDCDAPDVLSVKECERLNFRHPREYYDARQTEAEEKKWSPSENVKMVLSTKTKEKKSIISCQGTYPIIADLKVIIRKEAIRVARAVILHDGGAPVEGDEPSKKKRRKAEERDPLDWRKSLNKRKSQNNVSVADLPPNEEPTNFSAVPSLPAMTDIPLGNLNPTDTPAINPSECKDDAFHDTNIETGNRVLNAKEINLISSYGMSSLAKDDTALSSNQIDASNRTTSGKVGRPLLPGMNSNDMSPMMNGIGMSGMGIGGMTAMNMTGVGVNGMNSVVTNGMGISGMGSVGGMHGMGINGLHTVGMNGVNVMGMNGVGMNNMSTLGMHSLNGVGMNGMNAMAMHNVNSMGMNAMDQIMMAQSMTQNLLCPTTGDMNDFNQSNFAFNGMDTSQNFNSMLNLQRNMNAYPLIASDFRNAAMDVSWRGMSSLGCVVPGAGSNMLSSPYGHLGGNFNMNGNGNYSGEETMMSNGATTVLPGHNMMMMGAAGGMDGQYGNSVGGMSCQMMLRQQRQQQLYQQGQDAISTHLNDIELNTMGDMAGGASLLNKSSMVNLGIESIHNKFAGSLNPYQSNFYAGAFSGVNFYPTGGAVGNTTNQLVSDEVGSLMGSSPKFCSKHDVDTSCDE